MTYAPYHTVILPVRRNRQDEKYDCGPASLKIILETIHRPVSEKKLMDLGKTTPEDGTTPEQLINTLRYLSIPYHACRGEKLDHIENEIRNLRLVLVDYQSWGDSGEDFYNLDTGHYSVVFGFNDTHFFIADPSKTKTSGHGNWGFRTIRKDLFGERWVDKEADGTIQKHFMISVPIFSCPVTNTLSTSPSLLHKAIQFCRDALTKGAKI